MGNSKERMDIVSNQNVATPRFYISLNEYLHSVGKLEVSSLGGQDVSAISRLNPTNPLQLSMMMNVLILHLTMLHHS